ncbi:hypothetical protein [Streptomyces sp. NPDC056069]|uniref:hypothetical protein n=1 Tax=Streptomyces sp. NPDC056069 TaxID=3345702 RepID=UPI0035E0A6A5
MTDEYRARAITLPSGTTVVVVLKGPIASLPAHEILKQMPELQEWAERDRPAGETVPPSGSLSTLTPSIERMELAATWIEMEADDLTKNAHEVREQLREVASTIREQIIALRAVTYQGDIEAD